jgi:Acyl-CoA dehydrogenase, C-terminal domain
MDLVGPVAQTMDCPLEKWFRDAKIYQLFEGTAEVQRMVVSRMQAAEYRERFKQGAEVAAQAIESAAGSGNGSRPSGDGTAAAPVETGNGAGRPVQEPTTSAA